MSERNTEIRRYVTRYQPVVFAGYTMGFMLEAKKDFPVAINMKVMENDDFRTLRVNIFTTLTPNDLIRLKEPQTPIIITGNHFLSRRERFNHAADVKREVDAETLSFPEDYYTLKAKKNKE